MLCWQIGENLDKSPDYTCEPDDLDQHANDYFSALEHISYDLLKNNEHYCLIKECKLSIIRPYNIVAILKRNPSKL